MGLRCFLWLVFMVHTCFALDCSNVFNNKNTTCDECIRCDGIWCKDPNTVTGVDENKTKHLSYRHHLLDQGAMRKGLSELSSHTYFDPESSKQCRNRIEARDYWCPDYREHKRLSVEPNAQAGKAVNPKYVEVLAQINQAATTTLVVNGALANARAHFEVLNTTQDSGESKVEVRLRPQPTKGSFGRLDVTTIVHIGFCSPKSTKSEYVFVKVSFEGFEETAIVKYHVPCACGCSEEAVVNSPTCSGAGTLTCGSCQCNENKDGRHCERTCPNRGDIQSSSCQPSSSNEEECSGNGKCDNCGICHCDTNNISIPGSQYFSAEDNCRGICSAVEICTECLLKNELGPCDCETPYVNFQKRNDELLEDEMNGRKMWVDCNVTLECGNVEFAVSKKGDINVMMLKGCEIGPEGLVATGSKVTIPVVIGVIAAVAGMVAAAAGYVAWKGKGALPTAGSNYANIEPEDSVGVNPLYKPPTSSFKNPMFGKS